MSQGVSDFGVWFAGALLTISMAITGALYRANDRRISRLEDGMEALDETTSNNYRSKDDCKIICEGFQRAITSLESSMDKNFETLHTYLRADVAGLHHRIDSIVAARKACKCQEG